MRRAGAALLALATTSEALSVAPGVHAAEWLSGPARGVSRAESASRDAPVLEWAYGPRAQLSLGVEPSLVTFPGTTATVRVGALALWAAENGTSRAPTFPTEASRRLFGASLAIEWSALARRAFGDGASLETTLAFVSERAVREYAYVVPDRARDDDVPFGASGNAFSLDVALRARLGPRTRLTLRVTDRAYLSGIAEAFGARVASQTIAGFTYESFLNAVASELVLRHGREDGPALLCAAYAERAAHVDEGGRAAVYARALCGLSWPRGLATVTPFAASSIGNGKGWLVNRREWTFSLGVRLAAF